jgi:hypothetical protein
VVCVIPLGIANVWRWHVNGKKSDGRSASERHCPAIAENRSAGFRFICRPGGQRSLSHEHRNQRKADLIFR